MSGDIQTRQRRKEKRKQKRDEPTIGVDTSNITEIEKKNVQMHISEDDHDVGWFAKIVFFFLMAILTGLIVLIVIENRGGSDVDTPLSQSRFSEYFQGLVDETRQDDHLEERNSNQNNEHAEDFANDVLEDEKDMSNFDNDISEELNREANMFELETESPEIEDEAIGTDSTSKFEDNTLFLEDSTPFEEEEDNEIDMEDFTGSNDEGEDLLLKKLSEQAEQEYQENKESSEDKDDEPEFSRE